MYLMYYLDPKGERIYTLKVSIRSVFEQECYKLTLMLE